MAGPLFKSRSGMKGSERCLRCLRSVLRVELLLRDARAHDPRGGLAARDDVAGLVDDLGAAPFLVSQGLHTVLPLLALDKLHVSSCPALGVVPSEEVDAERVAVEARQGDELPAEAQLREVPDETLHLGVGHAGTVPIEGGAQIVGEHLVGHSGLDLGGELDRLAEDRLARLHPDAVGIRGKRNGTLDAEVSGTLDAVVALDRACGVPIEVDVTGAKGSGGFAHVPQGHLQGVLEPLGRINALRLQHLGHGIRVGHAAGTVLPVLVSTLLDRIEERLAVLDGGTLDVGVVDRIDVGVDHGGGLRIGARDKNQRRVEDVGLQAAGNEALDVLPRRYQDLAAHVPALLRAWLLILDVDARSAVLDEHLCELHGRRKTSVTSVRIRDDGIEVIHHRSLGALLGRHAAALFVLLPVMEQLGLEELIHLVRHRVVRVVRNVGAGLIGGRGRGARLPAAYIDRGNVLRHLHHLHGVQGSKGMGASSLRLVVAQHGVELLRDLRPGEMERHGPLQLHDVLRLVGTDGVLEAIAAHPSGHGLHPGVEVTVL
mmetsp:Transcript_131743/g.294797  ORF Transcript_131743/g.294797 Transcript_131743/m.294797 type:complete len:543 (-) Transcript_131743:149-1777(-)